MLVPRTCLHLHHGRPQTTHLTAVLAQLSVDSSGLGAVVDYSLLEPRMLQGLLGGYPGLRVVDEDSAKEIEELPVEGGVCRNEFLEQLVLRITKAMNPLT